jgi:hypothetical protein
MIYLRKGLGWLGLAMLPIMVLLLLSPFMGGMGEALLISVGADSGLGWVLNRVAGLAKFSLLLWLLWWGGIWLRRLSQRLGVNQ